MTKFFIALALLGAPVLSAPAAAETVSADGVTYVYTVEQKGIAQIITGRELGSGRPLRLRVARGWVQGEIDGSPVRFRVEEAKGALARSSDRKAGVEIVSR